MWTEASFNTKGKHGLWFHWHRNYRTDCNLNWHLGLGIWPFYIAAGAA